MGYHKFAWLARGAQNSGLRDLMGGVGEGAFWIPFLPERIDPKSAQVWLRRARMQAWALYQSKPVYSQVGPLGIFLDPRRPCWINEEEVPKMGVRLERRWQFGRWQAGSYHVWLQRHKSAGRGERSSGLQWDALLADEARLSQRNFETRP